ncbi:MAG: M23 family metallopeptidase, partial [Vampirovibrionia bacterium]
MADKDSEQLAEELDTLEIPGNQNPWKKKDSRYTNTILSEAAGTAFSSQTLSNLVRRDQNILEGVQNRTSLIIATSPVSEYEKLKYSTSTVNTTDTAVELTKVYTRNAESKNYFIDPPWKHKDDPVGNFKKEISRELHTQTTLNSLSEGINPQAGQFFDILYTDQTQDKARLLKMTRAGYTGFPELFSSIGSFNVTDQWPGNDNVIIKDKQTSEKKGSTMETVSAPKGSIVEEISKFWSPIYNPCAAPPGTGTSVKVSSKFGPRIHPTKNTPRWHYGIDIGVRSNPGIKAGYPIVAIADGVVRQVGPSSGQPSSTKIAYVTVEHSLPEDKKNT